MTIDRNDERWMAAALALAERGIGLTTPNPSVGCILVKNGIVVGRGWTQKGGRPHAEAVALAQAGARARGATAYVTLEPCAHQSVRGPACTDSLIAAGVARVVAAMVDPDPRTAGQGFERLRRAGIAVEQGARSLDASFSLTPFLCHIEQGRPLVTLKIATSLDGRIAMADGSSHWITGARARAHAHLERARHDAILIGRGTLDADNPRLDVRLTGLESRSPRKLLLSCNGDVVPEGWTHIAAPDAIARLDNVRSILVEGGPMVWSAFIKAGLADRLLLYRAPIIIGEGRAALGDIGLENLADAHGRWRLHDARQFGKDRMELYETVL